MPWSSMFILEMAQTLPSFSWPAKQVAAVAAVLFDVVLGQDQHAARARAGVIDAHAFVRIGDLHHQAHDGAGRVELSALLACGVSEVADQVLVGGPQQVGELEAVLTKRLLIEVHDELTQLLVRHRRLTDLAVEVDVLQYAFEEVVPGLVELEVAVPRSRPAVW